MSDWRYPGLPTEQESKDPCDGCHECGLRCMAGVQMTAQEFEHVVAHLRTVDPPQAIRILEQEKEVPWFEDIMRQACLFYDMTRRGCLIYPARPLVCRLFGRVEWLPCPLERPVPRLARGLEIAQWYAGQRRMTFAEWCMDHGLFDLRRLIAEGR